LLMLGLWRDTEHTNQRIDERISLMIQQWLISEVESLLAMGYNTDSPWMKCIGYSETIRYLSGEYTQDTLINEICVHSHQYAKRQRTRFRRYIQDQRINPKTSVSYEVLML
jgi:tRNA dimethylallyltransferase